VTSLEKKVQALRNCEFLTGAPEPMLATLAGEAELSDVAAGESVITKGESGSSMYVIISGRARVHDGDIALAELGAGEVFGEMAVLDADVRSASVTTLENARLLRLGRDSLFKALADHPECFQTILHAVLHRERKIVHDIKTRTERLLAYAKELEIGRRIQADFLPDGIPDVEGWEIAPWFEAAREVAGDFYDVFRLKSPAPLVALVIGDVCDKGVGAALYMTLFRSLIRASALFGYGAAALVDGQMESPYGEVGRVLLNSVVTTNRYVATTHPKSSMFASMFFGLLDPDSGRLVYVNAGHESPVIFRSDGGQEALEVTGGVLGLFPGAPFQCRDTTLKAGDLILAYTDGVNEAKNEQGEQFSDARIQSSARSPDTTARDFLEDLHRRILAFRGRAAQFDDITMIAARRLPLTPRDR